MQDYNDERDLETLLSLLKEKNSNLPSIEKIKNDTEYVTNFIQTTKNNEKKPKN